MLLTQVLTTRHSCVNYPSTTLPTMNHKYRFIHGDRVRIISGKYAGAAVAVDSKLFSNSRLIHDIGLVFRFSASRTIIVVRIHA